MARNVIIHNVLPSQIIAPPIQHVVPEATVQTLNVHPYQAIVQLTHPVQ